MEPELATLVTAIPEGSGWVFEMKLDGYRALARLDGGEARIATRSGHDWTARFPEIAEALRHLRARSALFDGEIAWVLPDGRTDFQSLQNALGARTSDRSRLVYFVFDLLFRDGVDLLPASRSPSGRRSSGRSSPAWGPRSGSATTSRAAAPRSSTQRAASASRESWPSARALRTDWAAARTGSR